MTRGLGKAARRIPGWFLSRARGLVGSRDRTSRAPSSRGETRFHLIGVGLVVFAFVAHSVLSHRSQVFGPAFTHGSRQSDLVALTFDDGPNDPYTTQILDILKTRGEKATFFVIGENALQFPSTVRREVAEGMEIGNHSYNHGSMVRTMNQTIDWQIDQTQETLQRIAGIEPKWFRPPHGFRDPVSFPRPEGTTWRWPSGATCRETGPAPASMSSSNAPWTSSSPATSSSCTTATPYTWGDRSQTVAALPLILDGIRARGAPLRDALPTGHQRRSRAERLSADGDETVGQLDD